MENSRVPRTMAKPVLGPPKIPRLSQLSLQRKAPITKTTKERTEEEIPQSLKEPKYRPTVDEYKKDKENRKSPKSNLDEDRADKELAKFNSLLNGINVVGISYEIEDSDPVEDPLFISCSADPVPENIRKLTLKISKLKSLEISPITANVLARMMLNMAYLGVEYDKTINTIIRLVMKHLKDEK